MEHIISSIRLQYLKDLFWQIVRNTIGIFSTWRLADSRVTRLVSSTWMLQRNLTKWHIDNFSTNLISMTSVIRNTLRWLTNRGVPGAHQSHLPLILRTPHLPLPASPFTSLLSNSTQQVLLDGETSDPAPETRGGPQSTVLGPILLLIYINDLPWHIKNAADRLQANHCIQEEISCTMTATNYRKTAML